MTSFSWLMGEVRENLKDFRKACSCSKFYFSATACSPTFHKTKNAINKFGIKYWISNPEQVKCQENGSSLYVKMIIGEKKLLLRLTGRQKLSGNMAISLNTLWTLDWPIPPSFLYSFYIILKLFWSWI